MNRAGFYPRLAVMNIRKNGKFYVPYLLTCIGTVAMFYIMCFIVYNEGLDKMPGSGSLSSMMGFGSVVIGIFSAVFLFYTNSFLIKRRKKEFGLYNILGMEKRHISRVMFYETLFTGIFSIAAGLICGVLFSKLAVLLLYKLLTFSAPMGFYVSGRGILITAALFFLIFFLILISNFFRIRLSKPIELLHGGNTGEREPRTKRLLAVFGTLCICAGYTIAIVTESPLDAIFMFFIAVILVIAGTYCLFIAGSIVILKMLRRKKRYYYQTNHFISVSSMLYRMKQNAAGLASICILCTMVLVMVSGTVCLYLGVDDALENRYPTDIALTLYAYDSQEAGAVTQAVTGSIDSCGRTAENFTEYESLSFSAVREGDSFLPSEGNYVNYSGGVQVYFLMESEYKSLTGERLGLRDGEAAVYSTDAAPGSEVTVFGKSFSIAKHLESFPLEKDYTANLVDFYYFIVPDNTALRDINELQRQAYGDGASNPEYYILFDIDGTKEEKIACAGTIRAAVKPVVTDTGITYSIECRQDAEAQFYSLYGGFLFLGLFLGLLFLMATVLIIYYKQISEGYDDKERFEIMQKVGMARSDVKSSVKSQILTVFFLPLIAAIIHIAAAFKMITKLLSVMNLMNVPLFAWCTLGTVLAFGVIYALVYALTARVYYRIVE